MNNYERERAIMEAARNSSCDAYFTARPQIDSIDRRRVYEAGFQAGAASRDAEVQRLQMALADAEALELGTAEKCDQLRAQINAMREAVRVVETDSEEVLDFDEFTAMCVPMDAYHGLVEAAEATPEQSLATHRNKVIEECAAVCDKRAARKNDGNWTNEEWGWICDANALAADEIRELKETP